MLKVLIVEDDPMVSSINQHYLERIIPPDRLTLKSVSSAQTALSYCQKSAIDLLLLDVYLPKISGTELLQLLTDQGLHPAVIMLTAANDSEQVTQALNYGVIDYLLKPFSFARFKQAINRFLAFNKTLLANKKISQPELDQLFSTKAASQVDDLPKGLSSFSLNKIKQAIKQADSPFSNQDIARISKLSRISSKKYLDFLEETGYLNSQIQYLKVGRPTKIYRLSAPNNSTKRC